MSNLGIVRPFRVEKRGNIIEVTGPRGVGKTHWIDGQRQEDAVAGISTIHLEDPEPATIAAIARRFSDFIVYVERCS